jgi:hypothetical protein
MVDANIKKVIIPYSELPAIYGETFTYNVRYRIISEDRNRQSHWSRIYTISASQNNDGDPLINPYSYNYVKETVTTSSGTTTGIRLGWQLDPGAIVPTVINTYDIFVKRDAGAWEYLDTTTAQTYTILRTGTETLITIAVQAPTYPKERSLSAELFETSAITVP